MSWQIREPEVRRSRAVSPKTPPPFEPQPPIERPDFVARISVGKSAANLECASLLALWFAAAVQARCPYHKTTTPRRISLHCGAGFQPADRLRASQTEGLTLLCPSYEGGPQGVSAFSTPPAAKNAASTLPRGTSRLSFRGKVQIPRRCCRSSSPQRVTQQD